MTRSLTIRVRWALVCAGLVTVSGAIVLAVMLVMTDRLLREGARDALGAQPQGPPRTGQAPPRPVRRPTSNDSMPDTR